MRVDGGRPAAPSADTAVSTLLPATLGQSLPNAGIGWRAACLPSSSSDDQRDEEDVSWKIHVAFPAAVGAAGAGEAEVETGAAAALAPPRAPPRPRPRGAKPPRPPRAGPVGGPCDGGP